jgi:hypothetical protein
LLGPSLLGRVIALAQPRHLPCHRLVGQPVGRRHALPSQGVALRHNSEYVAVFVKRCT